MKGEDGLTNSYKIKLTAKNGKTVEISDASPVKLLKNGLEGFGSAGFDVKINPYASLSGGYPQKRRFAERYLSIKAELGGDDPAALRRELASLLDPRTDVELEINMYGVHRKISVIPYGVPEFIQPTTEERVTAILKFVSPTVFFCDSEKRTIELLDSMPLLTFPMNFTEGAGMTAGYYRTTNAADINNPGDTECGIIARIGAADGSIVNPTISCGDKFIKCFVTLDEDDVLIIDTRPKMKNILLNGEKYCSFDRDSTFFSLPSGAATVSVTCDSGGEFIDAEIEYTPLYYGV